MKGIDPGLHYPLDLAKLPSGWTADYVGAFAEDIQSGFACGSHSAEDIGVPHLRPMNVSRGGRIELTEIKYVSDNYDDRRLNENDVLFNNTNSPQLIGKTAFVGVRGAGLAFSNHMTRLRFLPVVDPRFAAYQLHYLWMTGYYLYKCVKHVNQASISSRDLARTIPFVAPPLLEQHRIVSKIEELFPELDSGTENLRTARKQLLLYRQCLLEDAVEGKLTARWREENEKQDAWHNTTLGEVAQWGSGGTPSRKNPEYYDGDIPFLKTGELGPQYVDDAQETITIKALDNSSAKVFPKGSVGVAMYGATIGKTSIFGKDMATNQACAVAQPDERLNNLYLYYFLISQKPSFVNLGKGGAQPNISQGILKSYPFTLPSKEEQTKIIELLEERLSVIDQTLSDIDEQLDRSEVLRQSLLKAAFSGNLVEQDENDEPASALLERTQAEHSVA